MVEIMLFLHWKPCPDMGIEGEDNFDPEVIREYGKGLREHLATTADQLELLRKNGWEYQGGLYDILCTKDISLKEAQQELKRLNIDEESMELEEEF